MLCCLIIWHARAVKLHFLPLVTSASAIVCAAVAWLQAHRATKLEKQITGVTAELREKQAEARQEAEVSANLKAQNDAYTAESAALRGKLASVEPAAQTPAADPVVAKTSPSRAGGMFEAMDDALHGMMNDPETRETMRQQQRGMITQMYADFIKMRGMSALQSEQFIDLLLDKQMALATGDFQALSIQKQNATGRMDRAQIASLSAETDRQLQMLLGTGGYAEYQQYEQTTTDRTALMQVRQQFALNNTLLRDDQANALLQVLTEERLKAPESDLTSSARNADRMKVLTDPAVADQFYQGQAAMNQRVLNRAGGILQPDQLSVLESLQKQQLQVLKLNVEMARKVMGVPESSPPAVRP